MILLIAMIVVAWCYTKYRLGLSYHQQKFHSKLHVLSIQNLFFLILNEVYYRPIWIFENINSNKFVQMYNSFVENFIKFSVVTGVPIKREFAFYLKTMDFCYSCRTQQIISDKKKNKNWIQTQFILVFTTNRLNVD